MYIVTGASGFIGSSIVKELNNRGITDIIAVAMYIIHFDPVYLTKKSIYLIMAVIGLINWTKLNKERNKKNE